MVLRKKKGIISVILAGCILFTSEFEVLAANPQSEAQVMNTINYQSTIASPGD